MRNFGRVSLRASLGIVAVAGTAIAALGATHPAQAASVLASVTSAVSCATTTACVSGTNTSKGPGVEGTSKSSYGVEGVSTSNDGLKGISASSNGVSGSSTSSSTAAFGVKGDSPYIGVFGESSKGGGVYGEAPAFGVMGTETYTGSSFAAGVIGLTPSGASNAVGVLGTPTLVGVIKGSATGVEGQTASGTGVLGTAQSGTGVFGSSSTGSGIGGYSNALTSAAGSFENDNSDRGIGVLSITNPTSYPLESGELVSSSQFSITFQVDGAGDVAYAGTLNGVSSAAHGTKVSTFGATSSTPTVEDSGSAELVSGTAAVRLDPTFASSIDPRVAYRVFLTPDGDTRGLYVATKTPDGFVVRETQGGRSTLAFDYRIIATKYGAIGKRMAVANTLLPREDRTMLHMHAPPSPMELKASAPSMAGPFPHP